MGIVDLKHSGSEAYAVVFFKQNKCETMDLKRKATETALVPTKKSKTDIIACGADKSSVVQSGPLRTSNLQAPIMLLSGHDGEVFCSKFSPDGQIVTSAGFDRLIFMWNVYGECENLATMKGHTGAVLDIQYSTDGGKLVSCSTDKTLGLWDLEVGERMRKFRGH